MDCHDIYTGEYGCDHTAIGAQKKMPRNNLTALGVLNTVCVDARAVVHGPRKHKCLAAPDYPPSRNGRQQKLQKIKEAAYGKLVWRTSTMVRELSLSEIDLTTRPRNPHLLKRLAETGLSQRQIAHLTGLDAGTISAIVCFRRRPNRSTVRLLTAALRCTAADVGLDEDGLEKYPSSEPSRRPEETVRRDGRGGGQ